MSIKEANWEKAINMRFRFVVKDDIDELKRK